MAARTARSSSVGHRYRCSEQVGVVVVVVDVVTVAVTV